ncbi:hypothetical protein MHYP_G00289540 [Metynnis hypsauchen]
MSGKNSKTRNTIQTQLQPGSQTATTSLSALLAPADATSMHGNPDTAALKLELLASLRKDIADIFKKELQDTLGDVLSTIQLDLQAVKTQLAHDKAANNATMSKLKSTVGEMEHALFLCSDDIAMMKATIESFTANVAKLERKCEDLESRSRRNNIRILGVPEGPDTCTTAAVAALLKEAFSLVKEPLLVPPDPPTQTQARELRQIKVRDLIISVFPDYTAKVARAQAAFNEVRRQLRGIDGARYGLIHPARLRITYNGVQKDFISAEEASDYAKTLISE